MLETKVENLATFQQKLYEKYLLLEGEFTKLLITLQAGGMILDDRAIERIETYKKAKDFEQQLSDDQVADLLKMFRKKIKDEAITGVDALDSIRDIMESS